MTKKQTTTGSEITLLVHQGHDPDNQHGFINTPPWRGSTVVFKTVAEMLGNSPVRYTYGLNTSPSIEALSDLINRLEQAHGTVLLPSGLAAITTALLAILKNGDSVLIPDNVYFPTRRYCDHELSRFGIHVHYYDPMRPDNLPQTPSASHQTMLILEFPGSQSFEIPDIHRLVSIARKHGWMTLLDNTWATPLLFKPLNHGIDISIQAGTKYYAGHSDVLIGSVSTHAGLWPRLQKAHQHMGLQAGTEEIYLTLRGMRTLDVRLERHEKSALAIAQWLATHPRVSRLLHPAFPSCPGHEHWKSLCNERSNGLFSFEMQASEAQSHHFLEQLRLFGLGYSWGGFESLAIPGDFRISRTVTPKPTLPIIRLSIGLEDPQDLIADLKQAFASLD
jgi:cysteine-S-conjugate beta-lyase